MGEALEYQCRADGFLHERSGGAAEKDGVNLVFLFKAVLFEGLCR